ncbi:sulfotransferase [Verrucomicrobiaceae bacterium R5-34]|nr:sulfotransferase [Verrucomicrobiaceae bacterium R5-34]
MKSFVENIDKSLGCYIGKAIYRYYKGKSLDRIPVDGLAKMYFKLQTFDSSINTAVLRRGSEEIRKPIFIVGAPRSGTTFLGDCFSCMPSVAYFFEPVYTKAVSYDCKSSPMWESYAKTEFKETYSKMFDIWLRENLHDDKKNIRICEKTPSHVFLIESLMKWFPGAQVIHIIRDGVDMAASHVKKGWLSETHGSSLSYEIGGYRNGPIPQFWVESERHAEFRETSDLHRSIWAWRTHVEAGLESSKNLDSNQYMELRYEDLLTDHITWGRKILDYLELESSKDRESFIKALNNGNTHSIGKGYKNLMGKDKELIRYEAGYLLDRLGY